MIEKVLSLVRGLIRPLLTFGIIGLLGAIGYRLSLEFADRDIALLVIGFLVGAGSMAFGFWFGERKKA